MTTPDAAPREPPPYLIAMLVAAGVFLIYSATLAPTTAFWDTSEYVAAAYGLGIPHPPGNPLFSVLAHTFGALPLAATYAVRINLFSAVTSAASSGLWFLVADRWMRRVVPVRWARLAAAGAGVLVAATSWTVWNQLAIADEVRDRGWVDPETKDVRSSVRVTLSRLAKKGRVKKEGPGMYKFLAAAGELPELPPE